MDSPPNAPLPLHPHHHRLAWTAVVLLVVAVVIAVVYLLVDDGVLHIPNISPSGPYDLVWVGVDAGVSNWHEVTNTSPQPVTHLGLAGQTIVGVARVGTTTTYYILTQSKDGTSTIYRSSNSIYTSIYSFKMSASNFSVDEKGKVGIVATSGATPQIVATGLTSELSTVIGNGTNPILLNAGGIPSVVYMNGEELLSSSLINNTWSKPVVLYTADANLPTTASLATDGDFQFALSLPNEKSVTEWKVISLNPLVVSSEKTYAATAKQIVFIGTTLESVVVPTKSPMSITLGPIGGTSSQFVTVAKPSSTPTLITSMP